MDFDQIMRKKYAVSKIYVEVTTSVWREEQVK